MSRGLIRAGVVSLLLMPYGVAQAQAFSTTDPRTLGMGGVGVAVSHSANAGYINPALLSLAREGDHFSLALPVIGGRFRDPDALAGELQTYQDRRLEGDLTATIDAYANLNAADVEITDDNASINEARNAARDVADAAQSLLNQGQRLSGRPLQGEAFTGVAIGATDARLGAALSFSSYSVMSGALSFSDGALVQGIIDAATTTAEATDQAGLDALEQDPAVADQLAGTTTAVGNMTSNLHAWGAEISELGLSLSRAVSVLGQEVAVGVTPKVMMVQTFHYAVGLDAADIDNTDIGTEDYTDFNMDLGLATQFGDGWTAGLVFKNLIAQEYVTRPFVTAALAAQGVSVAATQIKIEPQARLGLAHRGEWLTLGADVDLVEVAPVGITSEAQYLGLGAEMALFDWFRLRAGYRHNLSDPDTDVPTLGLGFSPFGLQVDVAYGKTGTEKVAALQLGFRF